MKQAGIANTHISRPSRLTLAWHSTWGVPLLAGIITAGLFLLTLQTHINGSDHPYATDVGELQNALPRWGTIHFPGYPLYSITGSLIVTLLRVVGIQPAAGASLVSLLWGALTASILVLLAVELGAARLPALTGTLLFSVSASMWIDSSIAEVHSMTMLLLVLTLYFAVRFDRCGARADLFWLGLCFSQAIVHSRSLLGLAPALFVLVAPRWRMIIRHARALLAIGLLALLLYLYLPLREWTGADWTFGNTSTWNGLWDELLYFKAARFAGVDGASIGLLDRVEALLRMLDDDLPLVLSFAGNAGLLALTAQERRHWRYVAAFLLALLPYVVVPLFMYAGVVGDALLALKLPVSMFAGVGLALLFSRLSAWRPGIGRGALALAALAVLCTAWRNYPVVIDITHDRDVEQNIAVVDQASRPAEPTVLMMLWGHSYWGAAYAQAYRGQLEGVTLVDHNAPLEQFIADGYRLVTLSETLHIYPVEWWAGRLDSAYLDGYAPGLVEVRTEPRKADPAAVAGAFDVNDALAIEAASVQPDGEGYVVKIRWLVKARPHRDYSVAMHLVAANPPAGPADILAQADSLHPVEGWYPVSQWQPGQVVQDTYRLTPPGDTQPAAVRVTAYYVRDEAEFVNGAWLVLPLTDDLDNPGTHHH